MKQTKKTNSIIFEFIERNQTIRSPVASVNKTISKYWVMKASTFHTRYLTQSCLATIWIFRSQTNGSIGQKLQFRPSAEHDRGTQQYWTQSLNGRQIWIFVGKLLNESIQLKCCSQTKSSPFTQFRLDTWKHRKDRLLTIFRKFSPTISLSVAIGVEPIIKLRWNRGSS